MRIEVRIGLGSNNVRYKHGNSYIPNRMHILFVRTRTSRHNLSNVHSSKKPIIGFQQENNKALYTKVHFLCSNEAETEEDRSETRKGHCVALRPRGFFSFHLGSNAVSLVVCLCPPYPYILYEAICLEDESCARVVWSCCFVISQQ